MTLTQEAIETIEKAIPWPNWWHHHGTKMRVVEFDRDAKKLYLESSAANVTIYGACAIHADAKGWFVEWQVIQSTYIGTGVRGRAYFTNENLQAAFGLTNQSGEFGDWLIKDFGADVAEQGTYIRTGLYLNIPCPGTGHDGDPNVSILLDDEMRQAITELLA